MLWINTFRANLRKVAIELVRYWPNTLGLFVTFYLVFLLLFIGIQVVGTPQSHDIHVQRLIVIMVLWFLTLNATQGTAWEVMSEATRGTLEQLYMSPLAPWSILFARMLATVIVNLVVVASMLGLSMATTGQWLTFDLVTLLPLFVLTVGGMLGIGFALAGLALVFKQVQSLLQIAQFLALLLVSLPVTMSPWLEFAPLVRGASMLRGTLTEGLGFGAFGAVEWALLAGNAAFYIAIGLGAFRVAERRAMRCGLLGQY